MPIFPLALLGALVFAFVNVTKFAQAKQWGAVLTQFYVWIAGIAAVFLMSASQLGMWVHFTVTDDQGHKTIYSLRGLDAYTKIIFGVLGVSLFATAFNQFLKSHDNNDTAATPPLFNSLNQTTTVTEPSGPTRAVPLQAPRARR